jgi:hypothetical protein
LGNAGTAVRWCRGELRWKSLDLHSYIKKQ